MVCHFFGGFSGEHGGTERSTTAVKEGRLLNDPKRLLGADFDQIPVSIIFDVMVRTTFLFCGRCNTSGISPYRIFCFVGNAAQVDPAA